MSTAIKPDLDSPAHIRQFVHAFYARLLKDEQLAPIFIDVANIDLQKHLPLICSYWEKLLLGSADYRRHTMNIHRELHSKHPLRKADFERWLQYFRETIDESFSGHNAERAKRVAAQIAISMHRALQFTKSENSES